MRAEDPGEAFARFNRDVQPCHIRGAIGARTRGVDHLTAGDDLATGKRHAIDAGTCGVLGDRRDLVADIFHAAFAGRATPPVEHGATVPVTFVLAVDRTKHDVVDIIERAFGLDLIGGQQLRFRALGQLHLLVFAQGVCEILVIGQIHVTVVLDGLFGHAVVANIVAQVLDEIGGELTDTHVERRGKLLAHAGIRVGGGTVFVTGVAFHHQHRAVERAYQSIRDPGLVKRDLARGYISAETAAKTCGLPEAEIKAVLAAVAKGEAV